MNVIFLDFDGVIDTNYYRSNEQIEEKIKILADICHTYNCKVVIEASAKTAIDEETLEIDSDANWVNFLFDMFKKYNIECIGRTPNVRKKLNNSSYLSMWKEDEIRLYLYRHPEITNYCIIDDDDLLVLHRESDLNKVRNHLVITQDFLTRNPQEEGLLPKHKEEVGQILQKENEIRRLVLKYGNKK